MRKQLFAILATILTALLCACQREKVETHQGMYYWRTTCRLTDAERAWMDSVGVETLYLRLFDVVRDDADKELGMMPNATISGLREADFLHGDTTRRIVPVVFIAPGVITKDDGSKVQLMAERLLKRIDAITQQNGLGLCHEVQIDYDWAQSNGAVYFDMLKALAERLHRDGRKLSTTIRLHQLALQAPPADRGVLMLYNTGRLQDPDETNSILSTQAVEPYLRHLKSYSLPLVLALPKFSMNAVFRDNEFAFLAPGLQLGDTTAFQRLDSTHWRSVAYQSIPVTASATVQGDQRLFPGDVIRREESSDELNSMMQQRLSDLRPDIVSEVITFW